MPFSNSQKLQSLGVATPLAIELQRQITANVGNSRRLKELGLGDVKLCDYVAGTITSGPMVATQAVRRGMVPNVATALAAMVNA